MRRVKKGGYDDSHQCANQSADARQYASVDENECRSHHGSIATLHRGRSSIDGAKFTPCDGLSMFGFRL